MKGIINKLNNHNLPTDAYREDKRILCLNENAYGCSNKVKEVVLNNLNYNHYPDDNCSNLRERIARCYGILEDNIMIGNGSGEILQILSRSILGENDEVITCVPTYPYYFVETVVENAKFVQVPLTEDRFDIDGILNNITEKTKIIYITNPNNPIGTIIKENDANRLIENVRKDILIVFDEAYYEYVTASDFPNIIDKINKHENVCVLRTFSKAYGLASMRVGYLIGSKELISDLNKVRLTFNVSTISQISACAALDDQEFINMCKEYNNIEKNKLYNCLDNLKISYIPSETNFLVIKDKDKNIKNALLKEKIVVKEFLYNDENYIRLTIGDNEIMGNIRRILDETNIK